MAQMIYAICALMIVMLLALMATRVTHGESQKMMLGEISSAVTGVGAELLDEIARYPYDPVALSSTTAGTLNNRNALREASTFGTGSPCNPNTNFSGCLFINDFHGKTATRVRPRLYRGTTSNVTYNVSAIQVRYVAEAPPHAPVTGTTKTFAKEVAVTVSSPELVVGGAPLQVTMRRIYTYPNL